MRAADKWPDEFSSEFYNRMKRMTKRFTLFIAALLLSNVCLAGAWGPGSFDNDDALDWVQSCNESKSLAPIAAALEAAVKPGHLDATAGAQAVAAAELVAVAKGQAHESVPKELSNWLRKQPKHEIAKLASVAKRALVRVRDPDASELRQLWKDSDEKPWMNAMDKLAARMQ